MATQSKQEDTGVYHLLVGTEVSAKYRGAFCEAQIKSVKKNVIYKVANKKTGKCSHVSEDSIRGILKIGSLVEVQFPEQVGWQECAIQSTKDRSSYTVVFDDGDERTLTRGSLCLKGDRHYAKSETLDNLPLTDPENFGTPVLSNKKSRQRRRPVEDEYDDDGEDQKTPGGEKQTSGRGQKANEEDNEEEGSSEEEEEDENEKRAKWLADPLMGKVVIVEPNDKRKHWFPGLVVNPLCYERYQELSSSQLVVRSFKTGKFLRVSRSTLREISDSNIPPKLDTQWQDIIGSAHAWKDARTVPEQWRTDIKEILSDSEEEDISEGESETKKRKMEKKSGSSRDGDEENEEKKNHDFLEALYKFMEDRGTPINKTPVLGYKDLDLYLLYKLVQGRKGSFATTSIKDWKQIYMDLGIPKPNPAAGYNVRTAYKKYLASFEEYCTSWKHIALLKKPCQSRSQAQTTPEDKKKRKRKEPPLSAKGAKKSDPDKVLLEKKKAKIKDKEAPKSMESELQTETKTRGRNSPVLPTFDDVASVRRSGQRRRASESSTASDVTTASGGSKKGGDKGSNKSKGIKSKPEEKTRNPGGPDSEPDESSRPAKLSDKKDAGEKQMGKNFVDQISRRIRRNSTSSLSTQYVQNDKLKVKYGHGKTFKLYDAKVLHVKQPEAPGEATEYLVHYAGWNSRHDEWIKPGRIVCLVEERSPVPPSPTSGSGKFQARRPKTPNGSRAPLVPSMSTGDVPPSSRLSVDLMSKFEYPAKEDSTPRPAKETPSTETVSLEPLKKNLTEEFEKAKEIRPISPVLLGPQTRRSKSPYLGTNKPFRPPSPLAILNPVKEEPALSSDKQRSESPKLPLPGNAEAKKSAGQTPKVDRCLVSSVPKKASPKSDMEEKPDSPHVKVDDLSASVSQVEEIVPPKVEDSKEEPVMDKKETVDTPEAESGSGEDSNNAPDANDSGRQSSPPAQQPRRTSGRRSKSPAYLSDSSWYGYTKRRRGNASENSPSPTPSASAVAEGNAIETALTPVEGGIQSVQPKRSPSPSLSVSSATSVSSGDRAEKEKSPVLVSSQAKPKADDTKAPKTRKRARRNSLESLKEQGETESEKASAPANAGKKSEKLTSEYDNFDEDVPNIALEKHKRAGRLLPRTSDKRPVPLGLKYKNATSQGNMSEPKTKPKKSENQEANTSPKPKKKHEEGESASSKRKIKKKKPTPATSATVDWPEDKTSGKDTQTGEEAPATAKPLSPAQQPEPSAAPPKEEPEPPKEATPVPDVPASKDTNDVESRDEPMPGTSNTERVDSPPPPGNFQQSLHPLNPPSSSKVLLENTPPTTPERSPTYISEAQDIDKHSPLMDTDMLDIGDEPKDSGDSGSSSSGFENPTSSSHELEKMDVPADDEKAEEALGKDGKTPEHVAEEQTPSPSHKKRTRGGGRRTKRRRTTSKSQGNRRNSYGNDQESESDNEADDETGETNVRKRTESGSRCKPKKKKAKARPEPPSAPPPLPREELESMSQDERIALLQSRMAEMRKVYHQLKQEVANIDRKRKRAKRREREAAEAESLSRSAKRGTSPTVHAKGAPADGKVESSSTSCGHAFSNDCDNKQAIVKGDFVDDCR